jgi:hypothetical protein
VHSFHSESRKKSNYAAAATGIYLPPSDGAPALALTIQTQQGDTTGAYYQELLGIVVATLMSTVTPLEIFSDCSSAIRRANQAASSLGPAVGHLQHGTLLQGICFTAPQHIGDSRITWVASHPERRKDKPQWTREDWGIHIADELAGALRTTTEPGHAVFHCNAVDIHAALTPPGTWQWQQGDRIFHGSLRKRDQAHNFHQYQKKRDI